MIAVNSGLGFLIVDARNAGNRYDLVVAGMVMIGLIGLALDTAMRQPREAEGAPMGVRVVTAPPKVTLQGVSMRFATDGAPIDVLSSISLDVQDGEFVCILGPSGCGKSTLLNIVGGFLEGVGRHGPHRRAEGRRSGRRAASSSSRSGASSRGSP